MAAERLQKYLARAGVASRRHAEELITSGRVTVNNEKVTELGSKVSPGDLVMVDGSLVTPPEESSYFLLYKPVGVVTTLSDPQGRPTVASYIEQTGKRLFPVGRLDYDAEGALLVTDDGALAHKLTHPSFQVPRTYLAKVKGSPDAATLDKLRGGVRLEDGMATPLSVDVFERAERNTWLKLVVAEGRPHLIKRLCAAVGAPVVRLYRPSYAGVSVDTLRPGELRPLSDAQVRQLQEVADGKATPADKEPKLPPRRHGRSAPGFEGDGDDDDEVSEEAAPPRREERKPARAPRAVPSVGRPVLERAAPGRRSGARRVAVPSATRGRLGRMSRRRRARSGASVPRASPSARAPGGVSGPSAGPLARMPSEVSVRPASLSGREPGGASGPSAGPSGAMPSAASVRPASPSARVGAASGPSAGPLARMPSAVSVRPVSLSGRAPGAASVPSAGPSARMPSVVSVPLASPLARVLGAVSGPSAGPLARMPSEVSVRPVSLSARVLGVASVLSVGPSVRMPSAASVPLASLSGREPGGASVLSAGPSARMPSAASVRPVSLSGREPGGASVLSAGPSARMPSAASVRPVSLSGREPGGASGPSAGPSGAMPSAASVRPASPSARVGAASAPSVDPSARIRAPSAGFPPGLHGPDRAATSVSGPLGRPSEEREARSARLARRVRVLGRPGGEGPVRVAELGARARR